MSYVLTGRQGNTLLATLRFKQSNGEVFDLTGSELVWRVTFPGGNYRKATEDDTAVMRPLLGEMDLELTPTETRALPVGSSTKFEVERRIDGKQFTLVNGTISIAEGTNDDV
jgi:hypothetical protein